MIFWFSLLGRERRLDSLRYISSAGNELGIILPPPFGREKIVVAAAKTIGILSANRRAHVINRAAAGFSIEKLADLLEDVILLMAKHAAAKGDL